MIVRKIATKLCKQNNNKLFNLLILLLYQELEKTKSIPRIIMEQANFSRLTHLYIRQEDIC